MLTLRHSSLLNNKSITVPSSKSISNRALIINALANSKGVLSNLSSARDTQTMLRLIDSSTTTLDVIDAGTTMRFLTAFCAVTNRVVTLTGTERMQQRPIGILVDALTTIGANITYQNETEFPPIQIEGFKQKSSSVTVRGDVSSQYISALLMIAPTLPHGLVITLSGKVGSRPYIEMTLSLMNLFGAQHQWSDNIISIEPSGYSAANLRIEPDWSSASYWFSIVALSSVHHSLSLNDMVQDSLQGDHKIVEIMDSLGVQTKFEAGVAVLSKKAHATAFSYDFADCPDLAQTVAVVCAAKGITGHFTGLESLKIKETDRVLALQQELAKLGAQLVENDNRWELTPSEHLPSRIEVNTYDDHRMAMAFAPLSLLMEVVIEDETVVDKSYPEFWEHLDGVLAY